MPTLVETYRLTKKTPDLPWNEYVCRPIAAVLVQRFAGSRVTPDQVTLLSLVVAGLSTVLLVALPGPSGLVIAVALFELSYVLDCADGMLARLRKTQSVQGHLLDFLIDEIKAFAVLAAASVRLYADRGADVRFLFAGLAGLVALASGVAITTFLRRPEIAGKLADQAAAPPRRSLVGGIERVARLLIHYPSYIWLAGALGHLELYFYPYVVVNAAYAGKSLLGVALRFGRRG